MDLRCQIFLGGTDVSRSTTTLWTTVSINKRRLEQLREGILNFEKDPILLLLTKISFGSMWGQFSVIKLDSALTKRTDL